MSSRTRPDPSSMTGAARARTLARRHGTTDPRLIAEHLGLTVETDDWDGLDGVVLLGTYADGTITVYERAIVAVARENDLPVGTVRRAVVAHELAHWSFEDDPPESCRRRAGWRGLLDRLRRDGPSPRRVEEAAAHAFAAELVDLGSLNSCDLRTPAEHS